MKKNLPLLLLPLLLGMLPGPAPGQDQPAFALILEEDRHLDILSGGRRVGRYMIAHDTSTEERRLATYKPYLHVYDASGAEPVTKGAGGQFTHHRGIFFGYSRLGFEGRRLDRWHMKGGEQVHRRFREQVVGPDGARFTSEIEWQDEKGRAFLVEERSLRFLVPPAGCHALIELHSVLRAPLGEVLLEGDPEHAGVQFRPADEVRRDRTTYYFPGRETDPKKDRDLPWVGERFVVGDRVTSVVMLNHPDNPSGTIFSAYRDYGRFGAYAAGKVPADGTFEVRYRWILREGDMPPSDTIQTEWSAFSGRDTSVVAEIREVGPK